MIKKILFSFLLMLIILVVFAFNANIEVSNINIESDKIAKPIKIVVVADLHSCDYGENQKEIVAEINKIKPDVIMLVGDIVDDVLPIQKAIEFFEGIKSYPAFYVSGNHEFWSKNINGIKSVIKSYGIEVLEGDCASLGEVSICGIDDVEISKNEFQKQIDVTKNIGDNFSILLAHRPEYIDLYKKQNHDLIISGHAHGGQWRIPFFLENGLFAPNQGLVPKYTNGIHKIENAFFVISRGLSKESTRIPRIFNRPEIVVINLK